ncbi:hypothetical protein ACFVWG_19455 [Kribbella sp. NPDC058245]|uniref:hypothetical protein n=1 Tax=Kribbella sp. NPDC058245 TaxID=3346399 RepID=UPI0036E5A146
MSTVDPIAARRAQRLSRQGQPKFLVWAIVAGFIQSGAAFFAGMAIGTMVNLLRAGVIDSSFSDNDPGIDGFLGPATMPVLIFGGIFGLIIAGATTRYLVDAYSGGEKQPIRQTVAVVWLVAVGLLVHTTTWTTPLAVGTKVDPVFQDDEPWSAFGWVMYRANLWLPALLIIIAVLVTLYALKHNRRLRQQIADRNRLLTAGRKVTGAITNVSIRTSQNDQGQRSVVGADVVVKFTDLQGTDRWVTRRAENRSSIPTADTALVLFDPLRPDSDDLIFVAFLPDPLPGDWIGTVA